MSETTPAALASAERTIARRPTGKLRLSQDVQIGDLVLNRLDTQGTVWVMSEAEGWWTHPEPINEDIAKAWDDGSYPVTGRYGPRIVTLTGSFFPTDSSQVAAARDQLVRALDLVRRGTWLLMREGNLTKGCHVWLSGAPIILTVNTGGRTDFSVGLRAPDPVKYEIVGLSVQQGDASTSTAVGYHEDTIGSSSMARPGRAYPREYPRIYPGADTPIARATLDNIGNYRTYPILTLKGPTEGECVINNVTTEQSLTVVQELSESETLVIDCLTRQVTLNGAPNQRFYLDLFIDWIFLVPGQNIIFFQDTGGSELTTLTISWRSGWIA